MNYKKKAILVVGAFFCLNASIYSQSISLKMSKVSVEKAMTELQTKSGYSFVYITGDIDATKTVSVNADQIEEAIKQILKGQGVSYEIQGKSIIIKKLSKQKEAGNPQVLKGIVKDASGEPIIGASVVDKSTGKGTITDVNGSFSLEANANASLEISYIGYQTQSLKAIGGKVLAITMDEDNELLDEVVVVGYGTMKKRDLTGAVASIKMEDAPVGTVSTISHALAGKAAGLQVNTISAQPGSGSSFRIRGAASVNAGNDPLIIIDGFPVNPASNDVVNAGKYNAGSSDNILASINPNDIESIEVLKDASSTAIYGARAGNGVIIVTTKKGKSGAAKVTYSGTISVQTLAAEYEMLDARQFMTESNRYAKEAWMRNNGVGVYGGKHESEVVTAYKPYYTDSQINNPVNDTDWFTEIARTGFQTQHNLSVNGGTEYTKYMVSANFFRQNGIVKNNDMERYTGRVNLE
uniref:SusC/RagA family TonB-linked outer membrane protein n=2 Tax=Prevotella heparinolytica TaxID=28113 RepID=UPI0035A10D1C